MMDEAFQAVIKQYCKPERYYHNETHLFDLMKRSYTFGKNNPLVIDENGSIVRPLYHAILWHDYHYNVMRNPDDLSNEDYSMIEYYNWVKDNPEISNMEMSDVLAMIAATEHHFDGREYSDYLTNFFLDIDILGFANCFEKFNEIQYDIDQEYMHFTTDIKERQEIFEKRMAFLKSIHENKSLRFRVIDPQRYLTNMAYNNIETYLQQEGYL